MDNHRYRRRLKQGLRRGLLRGVAALVLTGTLAACNGLDSEGPFRNVGQSEAQSLIQNNKVVVLDVRTPKEFDDGHLKGAQLENFYSESFAQNLEAYDKDADYLVYCASGGRSGKAVKQMQELGFRSAVNLDGGYEAWQKAGLPVSQDGAE